VLCIRGVPGLNLGPDVGFRDWVFFWYFCDFPQFIQVHAKVVSNSDSISSAHIISVHCSHHPVIQRRVIGAIENPVTVNHERMSE
jgi:hypothetical protein